MRGVLKDREINNKNLKECPFCGMIGMKKDRIDKKGLTRTIVYKCIYCESEENKTLGSTDK